LCRYFPSLDSLSVLRNKYWHHSQDSGEFEIKRVPIQPVKPYPFPWPFFRFLDAFPESIHHVAPPIEPLAITASDEFDLIILPYQVWYLAPSLPIQALLQDPAFKRVARGKPVVTVIACPQYVAPGA